MSNYILSIGNDSDKFSFLHADEWFKLCKSKKLKSRKHDPLDFSTVNLEQDEYPCILSINRYTFTIGSKCLLTDKKINKLVKKFKLPNDVTVSWKRDENNLIICTFASSTEERHLKILTKAMILEDNSKEIVESSRYDNPLYGIAIDFSFLFRPRFGSLNINENN